MGFTKPKVAIPQNVIDRVRTAIEQTQKVEKEQKLLIVLTSMGEIDEIPQEEWYEYHWFKVLGTTPFEILLIDNGEFDCVRWDEISPTEERYMYEVVIFEDGADDMKIKSRIPISN